MSGSVAIRVPAHTGPGRDDARLVGAWLHRDPTARVLHTGPSILSFDNADFMDIFLRGAPEAKAWEPARWRPLRAWRDWTEPPKTHLDLGGRTLYPAALARRAPLPGELDGRDGPTVDGALDRGDSGLWLRKLYLPVHQHFYLLLAELACEAPGQPPIDPRRVIESGFVVRRLIPDRSAERWQDWIPAEDGDGAWVELDGVDARLALRGRPLNPRALPAGLAVVGDPSGDGALRGRLGKTDLTVPLRFAVVPMQSMPPNPVRRTGLFAFLPTATKEKEKAEPMDRIAALAVLGDAAKAALRASFDALAVDGWIEEMRAAWRVLVEAVGKYAANIDQPKLLTVLDGWSANQEECTAQAKQVEPFLEWVWLARSGLQQQFDNVMFPGQKVPTFSGVRPEDPLPPSCLAKGEQIDAMLIAEQERSQHPLAWSPPTLDARLLAIHSAARLLERLAGSIADALAGGAGGAEAVCSGLRWTSAWRIWPAHKNTPASIRTTNNFTEFIDHLARYRGANFHAGLDLLIHVFPGLGAKRATFDGFIEAVGQKYTTAINYSIQEIATELRARRELCLPRFDADHLYAAWCFARVRGPDRCDPEQITWSQRTEPFCIADPHDILGLKPSALRLPDLPKLIRDIPRIPKAGALPMVSVYTPPDSSYKTGEEPKDTAREWGIAWVCAFVIPVFTIVAWILFSFMFFILIMIPGFAWMLLVKLCLPVPVPKKG